jgi:hypothetical protein
MIDTQLRVLQTRLSKLPQDVSTRLLNILQADLRQQYIMLPAVQTYFSRSFTKQEIFQKLHPSWYEDYFKTLPLPDRALYEKALQSDALAPPLASSLMDMLFAKVFSEDDPLTPVHLLPQDPMIELLAKDYKMIGKLCQFLGLHDLLRESKTLIQKEKIKLCEEALEKEEMEFLATEKEKGIAMPPIGLKNYDGKKEVLRRVLFERGMFRLAKCLANSHDTIKWYVMHMLDTMHFPMFSGWARPIQDEHKKHIIMQETFNTWTYLCNAFPS